MNSFDILEMNRVRQTLRNVLDQDRVRHSQLEPIAPAVQQLANERDALKKQVEQLKAEKNELHSRVCGQRRELRRLNQSQQLLRMTDKVRRADVDALAEEVVRLRRAVRLNEVINK
jgi:predicted nuclease with TOPRIM domain